MKKIKLLLGTLLVGISTLLVAQPQAVSYQAIIRDGSGNVLQNQNIVLQIDILQNSQSGTVVYSETHTVTTNSYGLVNVNIGEGTPNTGSFDAIDWAAGPYFLKTSVDLLDGNGLQELGTQQMVSVPYALYTAKADSAIWADTALFASGTSAAGNNGEVQFNHNGQLDASPSLYWDITKERLGIGTNTPQGRVVIQQDPDAPDSLPLFEVKDKNGDPVFVVYPDSVHVFLSEDSAKSSSAHCVSHFAVSGRVSQKGTSQPYLQVTQGCTHISFEEDNNNSPESGFAVIGRNNSKSSSNDYFVVSPEDTANIINPSQPRVYWYPNKNAFLTGQVLIESPDSVGTNSFSAGYESKAIGEYSQAMGYKAIARGNNSTAIGNNAKALSPLSYAFGNNATVLDSGSYAIGSGAEAGGKYSFAIGSTGIDSAGNNTGATIASGDYSYAFGMGAQATSRGAFSIGTATIATGAYSFAMGRNTYVTGHSAIAIGAGTQVTGNFSFAGGWESKAFGLTSFAFGDQSIARTNWSMAVGDHCIAGLYDEGGIALGADAKAYGGYSFSAGTNTLTDMEATNGIAMGYWATARGINATSLGQFTIARSYNEIVVGRSNDTLGNTSITSWVDTDPLFVIGNGDWNPWDTTGTRHNAVTVLKNGKVGIGTTQPGELLHVYGVSPNIEISNTDETESGIIINDAQGATDQLAKILYNSGGWGPNNTGNSLNFYNGPTTIPQLSINNDGIRIGVGNTIKKVQHGSFNAGTNSGNGVKTVTIYFPYDFANAPHVIVTVRGGDYSDVFAVTTRNVTTSNFQVNIYRVDDSGGGWAQNIYIDWIAWE